jgi:hypothetical protein
LDWLAEERVQFSEERSPRLGRLFINARHTVAARPSDWSAASI